MKRAIVILLVLGGWATAQEKIPVRFGIEAELDRYPQDTAQNALRSVLRAINAKRFDYALAQLAEPEFVNERVKQTGGHFEVMVREATAKLDADPAICMEMRKFLTDGA